MNSLILLNQSINNLILVNRRLIIHSETATETFPNYKETRMLTFNVSIPNLTGACIVSTVRVNPIYDRIRYIYVRSKSDEMTSFLAHGTETKRGREGEARVEE